MKLFDESILPEIPKKKTWNDKTIGIVIGILIILFFWYKYNQKQRRLIIEQEARRTLQIQENNQEKQNLQILKRELEIKKLQDDNKKNIRKEKEPLPMPVGFNLNKF